MLRILHPPGKRQSFLHALFPVVIRFGFYLAAAGLHVAPPAAAVFAGVEKKPAAIVAGFDAGHPVAEQQFFRREGQKPEWFFRVGRVFHTSVEAMLRHAKPGMWVHFVQETVKGVQMVRMERPGMSMKCK